MHSGFMNSRYLWTFKTFKTFFFDDFFASVVPSCLTSLHTCSIHSLVIGNFVS